MFVRMLNGIIRSSFCDVQVKEWAPLVGKTKPAQLDDKFYSDEDEDKKDDASGSSSDNNDGSSSSSSSSEGSCHNSVYYNTNYAISTLAVY